MWGKVIRSLQKKLGVFPNLKNESVDFTIFFRSYECKTELFCDALAGSLCFIALQDELLNLLLLCIVNESFGDFAG